MNSVFSKSFAAIALMSLGACIGGTGMGADGNEIPLRVRAPFPNTSVSTLQTNLGAKSEVPIPIEGVRTVVDQEAKVTKGQFTAKYGTANDEGDSGPAYVKGVIETPPVGRLTGFIFEDDGRSKTIARGRFVQAEQGDASVVYLPAAGSDMHVGMFSRQTNDAGASGLFGRKTTSAQMSNHPVTGSATYVGAANLSIDDTPRLTTDSYRGTMTANMSFGNRTMAYKSTDLKRTYDNGGPLTAVMSGAATYNKDGVFSGAFKATELGQETISGQTLGRFYGPDRQNVGLLFKGKGIAGAAVMGR